MKVLLVGGCGYIGSVLTGYLLQRDYSVRCLDMMLYGNEGVKQYVGHANYDLRSGSFCDEATRKSALEEMEAVVILGGLVGDPICNIYPGTHHHINIKGIQDLIRDLNHTSVKRAIFISTCSNYGILDEPAREDSPLNPLSAYARAKVDAERVFLETADTYCPTVLRLATAFGLSPRMRFDLTISDFIYQMYTNQTLEVYDADTWRPYCHVYDISQAIELVLRTPRNEITGEIFNVGGENATKRMIVDKIKQRWPHVVEYIGDGKDKRDYRVDFSKIRDRLGFNAFTSIDVGISELIDALHAGKFRDYDERINFYRNNVISYNTNPSTKAGVWTSR